MGRTKKLQLKAMNMAVTNFAESTAKEEGLSKGQISRLSSNIRQDEVFVNVKVLQTNKIYTSSQTLGNKIVESIEDGSLKTKNIFDEE